MTVTLAGDQIRICGPGRIEDAESLVMFLQADNRRTVDLAQAEALHTAVVQALLAFRPRLTGRPDDPFFRTWVLPGLTGGLDDRGIVTTPTIVAEVAGSNTHVSGPSTPLEQT
jgi:hypothetical protein